MGDDMPCHQHVNPYCVTCEAEARELRHVRAALADLVALKLLKDEQGKTPYYEENQPKAWAKAREVLDWD